MTPLETIQELLRPVPYNTSSFHWVEKDPPQDFGRETLETYPHKAHLGAILSNVPTELLIEKVGVDFLLWLWLHAEYEKQDHIIRAYGEITGKDWILLQTIQKSVQGIGIHQDSFLVEKTYNTITSIDNAVASMDIQTLLQQYAKSDIPSAVYTVIPVHTVRNEVIGCAKGWRDVQGNNESERMTIALDAMVGIALLYKNIPQAVCSFMPTNIETFMMYQMQGTRYEKADAQGRFARGNRRKRLLGRGARGLFRLDWQAFLVACTEEIARYNGFSVLGVRSGQYHPSTREWYDETKEVHLPLEKACEIYDSTAQRLGFLQKEDKNWYKSISRE